MQSIDIHTHMLNKKWFEILKENAEPDYKIVPRNDGLERVTREGVGFLTPYPAHMDYETRLRDMDKARVDIAIVSLTCPNVFFGDEAASLEAARVVNDDMANAQNTYPGRIRWMASLPWEFPDRAVEELKRARQKGAVGVVTLGNIRGRLLTDELFSPVWKAIDDMALPVLVHPALTIGAGALDIGRHNLSGIIGFMFDTSYAVLRLIFDGFFDTYPNLKLILAHGGGVLPYLVGRMDGHHGADPVRRAKISVPPSEYLRRIFYDTVVYRQSALKLCVDVGGYENVMYGSDYPHTVGDMRGCLNRVDDLPAAQAKAIRGNNALRVFKL